MSTKRRVIIVAIDGPAGSGKTTLAEGLAERLGFVRVDTGAIYRAVALLALRNGIDLEDEESLTRLLDGLDLSFGMEQGVNKVLLAGDDVTDEIRDPKVSDAASKVSALPKVRAGLLGLQRKLALDCGAPGAILEGRDIGTVVFPEADFKFFVTASEDERARRRYEELKAKGLSVTRDSVAREQASRDERDISRTVSPLERADDAVVIDSTNKPPSEVVDELQNIVTSAGISARPR